MPGQLNVEFWVAINISHAIDNWKPAAATTPLTAHIVGIETDLSLNIKLVHKSNISAGFFEAWSSFKSWPAEKTGP